MGKDGKSFLKVVKQGVKLELWASLGYMKAPSPKMTLAPVFYTLAQVKFNPIAKMSDYVDRIQERLRRSDFPDFRADVKFELTIRRLDEPQPDVQPQKHIRWSFTNTHRTEGYLLLSDSLVFHTTEYTTFSDFLEKTISGLSLIHEIVELAYVEKVGLRYLDAVVPLDNDALQQYLSPSLMGLSVNPEGQLSHSYTETVTGVGGGYLVVKTMITDGPLALSPDLIPLKLNLQSRFNDINGRNAVLDTDHCVANRTSFDLVETKLQLVKSHDIITKTFNISVTDYARKKWA